MSGPRNAQRTLVLVLFLVVFAATLNAATVTYSNPVDMYGTVANVACGPFGAICGAAQAVNSFIFLSHFYSGIYENTEITYGANAPGQFAQAALDFGLGNGMGGNFCGYYNRFGVGPDQCGTNNGVNQNYVDTKNDWLNAYAPGTTTVVSNFNGIQGAMLLADFLGPELRDHQDIELFIYALDAMGNPTNTGHVISPTSVTYDPANPAAGAMIRYQDPNFPTNSYTVNATINGAGYLSFNDPASGLGTVGITAGFAESPLTSLIPEPGTVVLLLLPLAGLWFKVRHSDRA